MIQVTNQFGPQTHTGIQMPNSANKTISSQTKIRIITNGSKISRLTGNKTTKPNLISTISKLIGNNNKEIGSKIMFNGSKIMSNGSKTTLISNQGHMYLILKAVSKMKVSCTKDNKSLVKTASTMRLYNLMETLSFIKEASTLPKMHFGPQILTIKEDNLTT